MHQSTTTPHAPQVAIILPVYNDEDHIAAAIESCLAQTLVDIEVIVVDDASTDNTVDIASVYAFTDKRVRLIQQKANRTAFQARRTGIEVATAPFIMFLDGDDELVPEAAAAAVGIARARNADIVGFGSEVIKPDGVKGGAYEAAMQPKHSELHGADILRSLFPLGKTAQGQLWRYLFDRALLVEAYASLPEGLTLPRANDLPIAFLSLMRATKYVSTSARLYRYFFRRGASGHGIATFDDYLFMASAIDSVNAISGPVLKEAARRAEPGDLEAIYDSTRRSIVGRIVDGVNQILDDRLRNECIRALAEGVGITELATACADYCQKALPLLASIVAVPELSQRRRQHVVLRASNLGTGGAQGVVIAQSAFLAEAGFEVTIAIDAEPDTHFRLAEGVSVTQLQGNSFGQKVANFVAFCVARDVDVVIDHYVLYNERWPYYVAALAGESIPTIGWIHNFALRPILDGSTRTSFLERFLPLLATTVVLSESDAAYWKLLGVERVAYLPNPASPLLGDYIESVEPRTAPSGRLEIVWWGRLQQSTKQVRELVEIGALLRDLDIDFRITIIGPDGPDLTARQLFELALARGIADRVVARGELHHDELLAATRHAHVFVSTSIIEGYPLALVEAQSLGLPIIMYELPWLATLEDNAGIVQIPQGDRLAAAQELAKIVASDSRYTELAEGSLLAARVALSHDFKHLYSELIRGTLSTKYSPDVTVADARLLIEQNVRFAERVIRRERRAVDRLRASVANKEKTIRALEGELERRASAEAKVPSVARSGVRGWLMNFLPTSMKQSSYYARHNFKSSVAQHREVLRSQAGLDARLRRIEASVSSLAVDVSTGAAFHSVIRDLAAHVDALEPLDARKRVESAGSRRVSSVRNESV